MDSEKKLSYFSETETDADPQTLTLRTRFLEAARDGEDNVVRDLLRQRPTIQKDDIDHALREASANGRGGIVKTLLGASANVDAVPPGGCGGTALQKAVENEHAEIVSILLEAGAKVNPDPQDVAAESDKASNRNSLEGTTKGSVNGDHKFSPVVTILQYAAKSGNAEIVEMLVNKGADVDLPGPSSPGAGIGPTLPTWPLELAAEKGYTDVVRILLNHGARIDAGAPGRTAIQAAVEGGHRDVVEVLLDASLGSNFDINTPDTRGRTYLTWGISHPEVVQLLLQRGADVRSRDIGGLTALHVAAEKGYEDVVRILLGFKPDINARDIYGQTCLYRGFSHPNIVRLLLDEGANTELQAFDGTTPLHRAIKGSHKDSVALLLRAGADTESEDYEYQKPLDILLKELKPSILSAELLELLLEHGCDIKGKTMDNWRKILQSTDVTDVVMIKESPAFRFGPSPPIDSDLESVANGDEKNLDGKPRINISLVKAQLEPPHFIGSSHLKPPTIRRLYSASGTKFLFPEVKLEGMRVGMRVSKRQISKEAASNAVVEWRWSLLDKFQMKSGFGLPKIRQVISEANEQSLLRCYVSFNFFMQDPNSRKIPGSSFEAKTEKSEISWIMRKLRTDRKDTDTDTDTDSNKSGAGADLYFIFRSEDFRSTLDIGWIPESGVDFFTIFINDLHKKWKDLLEKIDEHLDNNFDTLLENKGETADFIKSLLYDAQQWGKMQALLRVQVRKSRDLVRDFREVWWLGGGKTKAIKELSEAIQSMEKNVGEELQKISQRTKDMIQFELNLVSVYEARISVYEARVSKRLGMSMKRLSWITFVFLPLMFVASIFGMNIDVINGDGPHWTWVVKLGGCVFALVILVWLGLKLIPVDKWLEMHLVEPLGKKWKEIMRSKGYTWPETGGIRPPNLKLDKPTIGGQFEPKLPSRQFSKPKEEILSDDLELTETTNRVLSFGVVWRPWVRPRGKMRPDDLESGKVAGRKDAPGSSEQDSKLKGL